MKKICILTCGGTILMKRNNEGVLAPFYKGGELVKKVPEIKSLADISVRDLINIDSSNIHAKHWIKIATEVFHLSSQYDGFIIVHGTDTMAYTASALSFAIQGLKKPIVFTGSQKPLEDVINDGRNNLLNAIQVALMGIPEIFIVFGTKILRANRATKVSESSLDAFDSPFFPPLGYIGLEPKITGKTRLSQSRRHAMCKPVFNEKVLVISIHPSLDTRILNDLLKGNCSGFILRGFGPGNIPDSYLQFLKQAKDLGIPVVVLSQCSQGITQLQLYEVGNQALEAGAIAGHDMTVEAAATKLMWGIANATQRSQIQKLFEKNIAGEVTLSS